MTLVWCVLSFLAGGVAALGVVWYLGAKSWARQQRILDDAVRAFQSSPGPRAVASFKDPAAKGFDRTLTTSQQRQFLDAITRAHFEKRKH